MVGPSAPPIIAITADCAIEKPSNPGIRLLIIAAQKATKIPICAAAPSNNVLGLDIRGPKSVIAPSPKNINGGRIFQCASP